MANQKKQSTEAAVRDIRRRTRRKFSPEERKNQEIIRKILTHLGLYLVRSRPPPRAPPKDFWFDSPYSQVPDSDDYLHTDPEYSVNDYLS